LRPQRGPGAAGGDAMPLADAAPPP